MRLDCLGLAAAISVAACGNESTGVPSNAGGTSGNDCAGRAAPLLEGMVTISDGGHEFQIIDLNPDAPVLSQSEPGNIWTLRVTDAGGQAFSAAAMMVKTFMPDHDHAGPSALGIEQEPGLYVIEDLLLPMPAFYTVTVTASAGGSVQEVDYELCISAQTG